jgi:hypothetical protein
MFAVAEFSMQITWDVYTRYPAIASFCSMLRTFEFYCPRKVFPRLGTAKRPGQPAKKNRSWTLAAPVPKPTLTSPPFIKLLVVPTFCERGQLAIQDKIRLARKHDLRLNARSSPK